MLLGRKTTPQGKPALYRFDQRVRSVHLSSWVPLIVSALPVDLLSDLTLPPPPTHTHLQIPIILAWPLFETGRRWSGGRSPHVAPVYLLFFFLIKTKIPTNSYPTLSSPALSILVAR